MHADRVQLGRLPGRLADRDGGDPELRHLRDLLPALQHGDEPRPGRPARLHHAADRGARVPRTDARGPTATTGSTPSRPRRSSSGSTRSKRTSGACPADPIHDKHRFVAPLTGLAACFDYQNGCPAGGQWQPDLREIEHSGKPFLQNPTTCGVELDRRADVEYYDGYEASAEAAVPADDRLPAAELLARASSPSRRPTAPTRRRAST